MNNPELYGLSNRIQKQISLSTFKEYTNKIKWNNIEDSALDLGCGDGGVTTLIKSLTPCRYRNFTACDISEKMISHAKKRYVSEDISFRVMDMAGEVPEDMKGAFNHIFSFYALHWARDQEKLFRNIYEFMSDEGDCFMTFMGSAAIFTAYAALAQDLKWASWLKNTHNFISPYHGLLNPDKKVTNTMVKCGFNNIDVKCKKITNAYQSLQEIRAFVSSIEPFNMPPHVMDEFIHDYIAVSSDLGILRVEDAGNGEKLFVTNDVLLVAYATK